MEIFVSNIKCGGCSNTIRNAVLALGGIESAEIFIEEGKVVVSPESDELRTLVETKLTKLGYPPLDKNNVIQKAKSYVSCAVGKLS